MIKTNIQQILEEKNRTKYWLSNKTGITYANISRLANNKTNSIHFDTLDKICDALECTPSDIIKKEKND